jgi:hypothetical protein
MASYTLSICPSSVFILCSLEEWTLWDGGPISEAPVLADIVTEDNRSVAGTNGLIINVFASRVELLGLIPYCMETSSVDRRRFSVKSLFVLWS